MIVAHHHLKHMNKIKEHYIVHNIRKEKWKNKLVALRMFEGNVCGCCWQHEKQWLQHWHWEEQIQGLWGWPHHNAAPTTQKPVAGNRTALFCGRIHWRNRIPTVNGSCGLSYPIGRRSCAEAFASCPWWHQWYMESNLPLLSRLICFLFSLLSPTLTILCNEYWKPSTNSTLVFGFLVVAEASIYTATQCYILLFDQEWRLWLWERFNF